MMIDDNHISRLRLPPSLDDEAVVIKLAARTQTVVHCRGDPRAQRIVFREICEIRQVATHARTGPFGDDRKALLKRAAADALLTRNFESMPA